MRTTTTTTTAESWHVWSERCEPRKCVCWCRERTCLSQYAFMSLLSAVCLLILNCTTDPSCPATFRLMWSFSVFTPSCNNKPASVSRRSLKAPLQPGGAKVSPRCFCFGLFLFLFFLVFVEVHILSAHNHRRRQTCAPLSGVRTLKPGHRHRPEPSRGLQAAPLYTMSLFEAEIVSRGAPLRQPERLASVSIAS